MSLLISVARVQDYVTGTEAQGGEDDPEGPCASAPARDVQIPLGPRVLLPWWTHCQGGIWGAPRGVQRVFLQLSHSTRHYLAEDSL